MKNLEFLLIDDDDLHLSVVENKLRKLGIEKIKLCNNYTDAVKILDKQKPDLIILDFYLDNGMTGVDLVKEKLIVNKIPVIFLSTFYNKEIFEELVQVLPLDYISKSANDFEFEKVLRLSIAKLTDYAAVDKIKEFIFVKTGKELKKVNIADIEFIEVEGKYLALNSNDKKYLVRSTLNDFLKKLPPQFIKIHQTFIINMKFIESVHLEKGVVKIGKELIPFSRSYKKELLDLYYIS